MKKLYILFLLWAPLAYATPADPLSHSLQKLDLYIQNQVKEEKLVGCAVAVVSEGKVIFMKAYGLKKKGEKDPIDLNTVFQLGSISKAISSSLIALFQKQNLLSVKNSMVNYYPNLLPATQIQHVLSHTTGYERKGWNQKVEEGVRRPLLLKQLAKTKQSEPGKTYSYHNVVFSLIEEVVTKICNQPFEEAIKKRFFLPLKMTQTSACFHDFELQQNRAWPHQEDKKQHWQPSKAYSHFYHEAVCASGGINSSITDMATFLKLQMGGISEFLSSQDLAEFHEPVTVAPDAIPWFSEVEQGDIQSFYGLGWRIVDYQYGHLVFHGGYVKGFKNFLGFMPDYNLGIVILNNSESNFSFKAALMFFDNYAKGQ